MSTLGFGMLLMSGLRGQVMFPCLSQHFDTGSLIMSFLLPVGRTGCVLIVWSGT